MATAYRHRKHFFHGFLGTALWVLPLMTALAVGGFLLARDYFVPNILKPSPVKLDRQQPTRILSPAEARMAASDEPSRVWTEGVRPSDIPKLPPQPRARRTEQPKAATPETPATGTATPPANPVTPSTPVTTPTAPAPPAPNAPTTPPATDTGGGTDAIPLD